MLQFHHKFIQKNIFLICFFILFFGITHHIYAIESAVNSYEYDPNTTNVVLSSPQNSDVAGEAEKLLLFRVNLTEQLGPSITSFEALKNNYSQFRFQRCDLHSLFVISGRASQRNNLNNLTVSVPTFNIAELHEGYNGGILVLRHVIGQNYAHIPLNKAEVYAYISFPANLNNENHLDLCIFLKTNGYTENNKHFVLSMNSLSTMVFNSIN